MHTLNFSLKVYLSFKEMYVFNFLWTSIKKKGINRKYIFNFEIICLTNESN